MNTSVGFVLLTAFLAALAVVAIIVIVIRAPSTTDALTLIGAIIAFITPLITAVLALFRAEKANGIATMAQAQLITHIVDVSDKTPPAPGV